MIRWGVLSPVDPDGRHSLRYDELDIFRVELDTVSAAIAAGSEPPYGRADAVAQAGVLEAVARSATTGLPVAP